MGQPDIPESPDLPPPPDLFDLAALDARSANRRRNMLMTGFRGTYTGVPKTDRRGNILDVTGESTAPTTRGGTPLPEAGATVGPDGKPIGTPVAPNVPKDQSAGYGHQGEGPYVPPTTGDGGAYQKKPTTQARGTAPAPPRATATTVPANIAAIAPATTRALRLMKFFREA